MPATKGPKSLHFSLCCGHKCTRLQAAARLSLYLTVRGICIPLVTLADVSSSLPLSTFLVPCCLPLQEDAPVPEPAAAAPTNTRSRAAATAAADKKPPRGGKAAGKQAGGGAAMLPPAGKGKEAAERKVGWQDMCVQAYELSAWQRLVGVGAACCYGLSRLGDRPLLLLTGVVSMAHPPLSTIVGGSHIVLSCLGSTRCVLVPPTRL